MDRSQEPWRRHHARILDIIARIPLALAEKNTYWTHFRRRDVHVLGWRDNELSIDDEHVTHPKLYRAIGQLLELAETTPNDLQAFLKGRKPWQRVLAGLLVGMGEMKGVKEHRHAHRMPPFSLDDESWLPDFLRSQPDDDAVSG